MMDRLTSMAVFVRAAEAGSFAAAAPALGMSAPMIGKHVRFLEARVGAQLLHRTTRRQSLTEVGRAFLERCKLVLAEAEAAELLAQDLQTAPRGLLRVNAPVTFGSYSLTPMLTRYLRRYPEVTVDLTLTDRVSARRSQRQRPSPRWGAVCAISHKMGCLQSCFCIWPCWRDFSQRICPAIVSSHTAVADRISPVDELLRGDLAKIGEAR